MANTNADVVRLEGTWAGLTGILRGGQFGVTTDTPKKIIMKRAGGGWNQWTSDEDWSPGATGVSYTNAAFPTVQTVQQGLDTALPDKSTFTIYLSGITGSPATGECEYQIVGNMAHVSIKEAIVGFSDATTMKICGWPTAIFPATYITYAGCIVYDSGNYTNGYSNGMMQISAAIEGVTGQGWGTTGITVSPLKVDGVSSEPEYVSSGWNNANQKGLPPQTIHFNID